MTTALTATVLVLENREDAPHLHKDWAGEVGHERTRVTLDGSAVHRGERVEPRSGNSMTWQQFVSLPSER